MILNIVHSFVNIFAGGRSDIKVFLFIFYLIFLSTIYFLLKRYQFKTFKWKWFGVSLLAMYLYGFLLHILYVFANNLSLVDFFITGNNGEISSSTLSHTHVAKGVVGQVFSFFDRIQLSTIDAGGAYVGLIPNLIFLFGSMLLLLLLVQSIFYFVTNFKIQLADKNKRQRIFLIVGYAIMTFSLIKTSVDGGILNPSFIIGVIFTALFILRERGKSIVNCYYLVCLAGILLLFISLYIDSSFGYGNGLSIACIAALLGLYTVLLYGSEEKIRLQFFIPLIILFVAGWWLASARDRDIYDYSKIALENGQEVLVYNQKMREVEILKVQKSESVAQLSKQLNKNVTYMPIAVPGVTCMEKSPNHKFSSILVSTQPIDKNSFISSRYVEIKNDNSLPKGKNWETMLDIYLNPCLPEPLSVIDGELIKNNIYPYFLVNPQFYDTSHD